MTWAYRQYGYEKYAIEDERGAEIGFVHRHRDARLVAAAPAMLLAVIKALNFIANTESELGITLDSGEALREAFKQANSPNS